MKGRHVALLAAALCFLFFGLYTGDRFYYVFLFAEGLVCFASLLHIVWVFTSFKYIQYLSANIVQKGDTTRFSLELHNDTIIPYTCLKLHARSAVEGEDLFIVTSLAPLDNTRYEFTLQCPFRGVREVGLVSITAGDIFGLFLIRLNMDIFSYHRMLPLVVYPKIISLPYPGFTDKGYSASKGGGLFASDDPAAAAGHRKMVSGEPLSRIHWKLFARTRVLYVREYEDAILPKVVLVIDAGVSALPVEETQAAQDIICTAAASLIHGFLSRGVPVTSVVIRAEKEIREYAREKDMPLMLDYFARLRFDSGSDFISLLAAERFSSADSLYILTANLTQKLFAYLGNIGAGRGDCRCLAIAGDEKQTAQIDGKYARVLRESGVRCIIMPPSGDLAKEAEKWK